MTFLEDSLTIKSIKICVPIATIQLMEINPVTMQNICLQGNNCSIIYHGISFETFHLFSDGGLVMLNYNLEEKQSKITFKKI